MPTRSVSVASPLSKSSSSRSSGVSAPHLQRADLAELEYVYACHGHTQETHEKVVKQTRKYLRLQLGRFRTSIVLTVRVNGAICGYMAYQIREDRIFMNRLFLHPGAQRQGHAQRPVQYLIEDWRRKRRGREASYALEIRSINHAVSYFQRINPHWTAQRSRGRHDWNDYAVLSWSISDGITGCRTEDSQQGSERAVFVALVAVERSARERFACTMLSEYSRHRMNSRRILCEICIFVAICDYRRVYSRFPLAKQYPLPCISFDHASIVSDDIKQRASYINERV